VDRTSVPLCLLSPGSAVSITAVWVGQVPGKRCGLVHSTHIYTYLHIFTHIYTYVHIFTHIYIYLHIYLHIFTHIYTYLMVFSENVQPCRELESSQFNTIYISQDCIMNVRYFGMVLLCVMFPPCGLLP
jgi:hypothetical protein